MWLQLPIESSLVLDLLCIAYKIHLNKEKIYSKPNRRHEKDPIIIIKFTFGVVSEDDIVSYLSLFRHPNLALEKVYT